MALNAEDKSAILTKYGKADGDTGSAAVQVALLTARITYLTEHFKIHKKDHGSRRGLLKLVGQRRKLLKFIRNGSQEKYQELIKSLGLRR
jgi:small subunit ribosomal protein S15